MRWSTVAAVAAVLMMVVPSAQAEPPAAPEPSPTAVSDVLELEANVRLTHPQVAEGGEAPGDLAFWGDLAVVGRGIFSKADRRHNGFVLFDISNPSKPRQLSRFDCTNTGFDVSIWGDLVLLSQDGPSETTDCGSPAPTGPLPPPTVFAGLRIISIADPTAPVPIAAIRIGACRTDPTCPTGSHTHTVIPDLENDRLVVYANTLPGGVVVVPLDRPEDAYYAGDIDTLAGGVGGTNGCHDLQVHLASRLAACGSINEFSLWDISDPLAPVVFAHFSDPTISHHHSAMFSVDAETLVVQDESLVTIATEVSAGDDGCVDTDAGALRFYDISQTVADYRSGVPLPAAPRQTATLRTPKAVTEQLRWWCYGHYGNVVPIPPDPRLAVRNLLVMAWGGAGTWLVDFTDPAAPRFVGHHFDAGPESSRTFTGSSYWYDGHVYANNGSVNFYGLDHLPTDRGLEVFRIDPGMDEYGKQLRLALSRADRPRHLNPQTQDCIGPCPTVTRPGWRPATVRLSRPVGPLVMSCRLERPATARSVT